MKTILSICIAILFIAGCQHKPMIIRQFYPFKNDLDSTFWQNKMLYTKEVYFIISNYYESDSTDRIIDSLANIYKGQDYAKYQNYYMSFLKESQYTNEEYIKENPRSIDRYSIEHDYIYTFVWSNGNFVGVNKIKNGELVNPKSEIRLGPVPKH